LSVFLFFHAYLLPVVVNEDAYTEWPKNWHHLFVRLNFTNINGFSKLFHCQN